MRNFNLPRLYSESDVARLIDYSVKSIPGFIEQHILPVPVGVREKKFFWFEESLEDHFNSLHQSQAAYAAIDTLGLQDLLDKIYACPGYSRSHIGIRRPRKLVLIENKQARVYPVLAMYTEAPVMNEKEIVTGGAKIDHAAIDRVRERHRKATGKDEALTYFILGDPIVVIDSVQPQRGGTILGDSLEKALEAAKDDTIIIQRIAKGEITYVHADDS